VSELHQRPPGFVYGGKTRTELLCEQVPLSQLVKRFGTPLYVYSAGMIRERVLAFQEAFREQDHAICYSVKANSNLSILKLLSKLGCGFDVVSGGELQRVARVNRRATKSVVFSGVGKTTSEIEAALKAGILIFNVESASELDSLAACAARLKKQARVAVRVNPDVPADTHPYISTGLHKHKFGVPIAEARALYGRVSESKYLRAAGVSVHIGSQIRDVAPFCAAMERVAALVRELREEGHDIEFVDAGGGLGINYRDGSEELADCVTAYAKAVTKPLEGLGIKLLIEPGRAIVGPAGVLLTRVVYRKTNGDKKFVIVDAAMNDLIRPSLYQAQHQIVPVRAPDFRSENVDIVGPVCESGDFFARDRELPTTAEGDLLAILDAGAYGMVLASNYNTRPRPAEVLVDGKAVKVIRRRESVADLMRPEIAAL
jgi:diaminopimelate decarboxylase